ncbi:MAG TPA: helix-turn-helix domain-containing protein [Gaiellaceae bacterium]|jgi:DNA-binding IclR family transcriptional regulator|nr:helix-turn-helix domain-containing protein [Gaiellaceae bacterium]
MKSSSDDGSQGWSFLTNHARVLQAIAADPTVRLRDIAAQARITERTAAQIVGELERVGYLRKTRTGRRNRYELLPELSLRHPSHHHRTIGELIRFLERPADAD